MHNVLKVKGKLGGVPKPSQWYFGYIHLKDVCKIFKEKLKGKVKVLCHWRHKLLTAFCDKVK